MFCKNCGNELKDDDQFCRKCGAKIVRDDYVPPWRGYGQNANKPIVDYKMMWKAIGGIASCIVLVLVIAFAVNIAKDFSHDVYNEISENYDYYVGNNNGNKSYVSPQKSKLLNGDYADILGLTVYSFHGDILMVYAFDFPVPWGQWRYSIKNDKMYLTALTQGANDAVWEFKEVGDIIYIDDNILYRKDDTLLYRNRN